MSSKEKSSSKSESSKSEEHSKSKSIPKLDLAMKEVLRLATESPKQYSKQALVKKLRGQYSSEMVRAAYAALRGMGKIAAAHRVEGKDGKRGYYTIVPLTGSDATILTETDVQDSMETTFGLERDLQSALRANISQLEKELKITDSGKERGVPSGKIDILAATSDGTYVVVELKAGTADGTAIGQILAYMGDLAGEAKGKVRGILLAGDFSTKAISASKAVPNVELRKYGFKFSFQKVR